MESKKSKKGIIAIIVAIVVIVCGCVGYYVYRKSNVTEIAVGLSSIELNDELKSTMANVARDANAYYNQHKAEKTLTTQYGLLYSYTDKANITIDELGEELDKDISKEMDILYVKSSDVMSEAGGNDLGIFASINTSSGYYVTSNDGFEKTFTEEEFKNLLMKYAPTHGNIRNPQRGTDEHTAIITAAGVNGNNFDIKHIACDDKYAVLVTNDVTNPTDIREIALVKNNNAWTIVNANLATAENSYTDINTACPDMDLGLMPIYNIGDFGPIETEKMSDIADALVKQGTITAEEKNNMYACGCEKFAYIQTNDGKRFIGFINEEHQLEFSQANDLNETLSYMVQCQQNPPVFIVKFE